MGTVSSPPSRAAGSPIAWVFPGQGAQRKGIGADVFDLFPELCASADGILGYSVRELCLSNPEGRLGNTRYAQPAIYVVNALSYFALADETPAGILAGHSLGEYNALLAAGCFDFATGLGLVQERGRLMSEALGGGMLAVIDLDEPRITEVLGSGAMSSIDVANYNSHRQVVLSGPVSELSAAARVLKSAGGRCIALNVSAAFHSRYMAEAAERFADYLGSFWFAAPQRPVIANVTAEPYGRANIADLLARQIRSPVRWRQSMQRLRRDGVLEVREVGPGRVLSNLWREALAEPLGPRADERKTVPVIKALRAEPKAQGSRGIRAEDLGSAAFRRDYGIRYAYLAGSMFRGIASTALVIRMARAGLMGFLGTGGLDLAEIDNALGEIRRALGKDGRYGANLLHQLDDAEAERATVELYLRHDVRYVEAAAFIRITAAVVRYRFAGAYRAGDGRPRVRRHIVAKVSRPEVAAAFMRPAPEAIVRRLLEERALTEEEAEIARLLPISGDICVESDSAGHTDGGVALTLIPAMRSLREEIMARHGYDEPIRIGASGGLGTPEAVAAAFVLGAEFVVTGSINQCSPEAGTSELVKSMLQSIDVQDTAYAPAGDMFELGARVQVVSKGTLFAPRANKLYQLHRQHETLDDIPGPTRYDIETNFFRRSFEDVWQETREHYLRSGRPNVVDRAERDPKRRMRLLFKWYFAHSIRVALAGDAAERVNFQIHCGPAMGSFNRLVKGTDLEAWDRRHVDVLADRLMQGAAEVLLRGPVAGYVSG